MHTHTVGLVLLAGIRIDVAGLPVFLCILIRDDRFKLSLILPVSLRLFLTGLFCIGALCILFYFTVIIRGKDYFDTRKHFYISARFPHASTLAVNDKVKVIGVEMGTVDSLELAPGNNAVIVRMKLRRDIPIYKGYEMLIQNSSVFGGAYVNINPGKSEGEPLPPDTVFDGLQPIDIIKEASELLAAFREDEKYFREVILEGGVLEKLLNSRYPTLKAPESTGSTRFMVEPSQPTAVPTFGTVHISVEKGTAPEKMRKALQKAAKAAGQEYAYIVRRISGAVSEVFKLNVKDGTETQVRVANLAAPSLSQLEELGAISTGEQVLNLQPNSCPMSLICPDGMIVDDVEFARPTPKTEKAPAIPAPQQR